MKRYLIAIADGHYGCGNDFTYVFRKTLNKSSMVRIALQMRTALVNLRGYHKVSVYYLSGIPQKICEASEEEIVAFVEHCGIKLV